MHPGPNLGPLKGVAPCQRSTASWPPAHPSLNPDPLRCVEPWQHCVALRPLAHPGLDSADWMRIKAMRSPAVACKKKKATVSRAIPEVMGNEDGDCFCPYNPKTNVMVGQFVALTVELSEIQGGVPFYIQKVIEFGQGQWSAK